MQGSIVVCYGYKLLLRGEGPGFDIGDHGDADTLRLGWFMRFLQEVPDIDISILSTDVEYSRPCQGPVPCGVPFRCAARLKERSGHDLLLPDGHVPSPNSEDDVIEER